MSRRRPSNALRAYAAVRFECPRGHRLKPQALRTDPLGVVSGLSDAVHRPRYVLNAGIERVDAPDGRTKLRLTCPACRGEGRRDDLQVSWESTVLPLLDEAHADPTRGTVVHRIGGHPVE